MAIIRSIKFVCFLTFLALTGLHCKEEPLNIILLTYGRSGSSFVGELLSSQSTATYFFEPLYYPALRLGNTSSEAYRDVVSRLLNCDPAMLDVIRDDADMGMVRKLKDRRAIFTEPEYDSKQVEQLCLTSSIRVVKTIRFRMPDAVQLLATGAVPNLKVVHMVWDPRARYNSIHSKDGAWSPNERSPDTICGNMRSDLQVGETLPPSQYKLIKYEDLVSDPRTVLTDIFTTFFGLPKLPEETEQYILEHTQSSASRAVTRNYYSTIRDKNFSPGHWEYDLNQTIVETLQNHPDCKYILEKMHYPMKEYPSLLRDRREH